MQEMDGKDEGMSDKEGDSTLTPRINIVIISLKNI